MELLPLVCLCLLSCSGDGVRVVVTEGSDAVLPCSLTTEGSLAGKRFDWRKDGQKDVFMYDAGIHSNNGRPGQDEQFKGRVLHFQDQLRNGKASIKIHNTKMADSGNYSCDFPRLQPRQTFDIELVVVVRVVVAEGSDAVLPCSLSTKEDISGQVFDWKKGSVEEVFTHYSDGSTNQGLQFTDRVSHFEDQLMNGDASIKITNTKVADSGIYSCVFPHLQSQTFYIELVVGVRVVVEEDSDAVLPCLISTKEDITGKMFDWRKDGQKEVFLYEAGIHSNNGHPGQDEQFKGRVSHFQDQLKNGNASIEIRNTKMADSGKYSCDFPRLQPRQTFYIELVVDPRVKVVVEEDSDAVLPCLISTKEDISGKVFDWKKDEQKEVFFYNAGIHYNNGLTGQDEQFKGRVSHFEDQLQNGDASIKIRNTKMADSGIYSCIFPKTEPRQTFYIGLVVDPVLRDRTGAAPEPIIRTLADTKHWSLLQCEAHGVPRPDVEWKDSAGKTLHAEKPQNSTRRGRSYVTVKITVIMTGNYSCVATQKNISHQIAAVTYVSLEGAASKPYVTIIKTDDGAVLHCEVLGASPKPKVEWQDSSGNILQAEEPKVTERGGSYDIVLQAAVTKTDTFSCVVTLEGISHQISDEIYAVYGSNIGWIITVVILILLLVVAVVYIFKDRIRQFCARDPGSRPNTIIFTSQMDAEQ